MGYRGIAMTIAGSDSGGGAGIAVISAVVSQKDITGAANGQGKAATLLFAGESAINTASISAMVRALAQVTIAASKGGIIGLTRSMTVDHRPKGLRCSALSPGFIPFTKQTKEFSNGNFIDEMLKYQPLKGYGIPEDIARASLFLTSNDSSWIAGQTPAVDDGQTAISIPS